VGTRITALPITAERIVRGLSRDEGDGGR
jgi:hypothetical protein